MFFTMIWNTNISCQYRIKTIVILVKFKCNVDLKINDLYAHSTSNRYMICLKNN